ncbi:MAG: amino acid adenylation domain-containing protein [Acidimicrobiales bacterium]
MTEHSFGPLPRESVLTLLNERRPFKLVLGFGEEVSSGEFLRAIDVITFALVDSDINGGQCVSIETSNSYRSLVAMLAIWKLGAIAVPIDPKQPEHRQNYIRQLCGIQIRIVDDIRSSTSDCSVIRVANRNPLPLFGDVAHILFTSGSTGRPKGVMLSSGSIYSRLMGFLSTVEVSPQDSIGALTYPTFDISLTEMLLPLFTGCTLAIPPPSLRGKPVDTARWISESKISIVQGTPTLFQMLTQANWAPGKHVSVWSAGESLNRSLASSIGESARELWNLYGPTEMTIYSTAWRYDGALGNAVAPIGKPFPGTVGYLDAIEGQDDQTGELILSGIGVSEGYVEEPGLTSARFITRDGQRAYRTGDICSRDADGNFSFLGRIDNQVKVRGFRIETGDVEANLSECPGVVQSAVVAVPLRFGDGLRLVAVIVGDFDPNAIRDHLRERIPEFMIPSAFRRLDHLPLTGSGKIDRTAIAAMLTNDDRAH